MMNNQPLVEEKDSMVPEIYQPDVQVRDTITQVNRVSKGYEETVKINSAGPSNWPSRKILLLV